MKKQHTNYKVSLLILPLILHTLTLSSCVNTRASLNSSRYNNDFFRDPIGNIKSWSTCGMVTGIGCVAFLCTTMLLWGLPNMLSQPNIAILNSSNAMLTTAGTIPLNTANSNNVYPTTSSLDNWNEELISAQTNPLFSNDNTTVTTSQYLFNTTEPDSNSTVPTSNPADLEVSAESSIPYPPVEDDQPF